MFARRAPLAKCSATSIPTECSRTLSREPAARAFRHAGFRQSARWRGGAGARARNGLTSVLVQPIVLKGGQELRG
jgi:hypothetical protein